MPIKTVHNSPQLREWLRRDVRTIDHASKSEFAFPLDIFAKAVAQKSSHHPHMTTEQLEMRAAHLLLLEGHSGQAIEQKLRSHFSKRVFWEIVFAVIVIFLLLTIATRGHAQNRTGGIVIQMQNQGSNLGAPIGGGLVTLNASTNVTLARTGTTSLFTITATGGGAGSGCTPPGTTLNAILTDLTGGACGAATKWTASTTTMTGLATSIFDQSAGATHKLPASAGFAPTTANLWGYDTTNNRGVLGNGTDTSFLTWIHGTAPANNDCVKFSGTLGALITNGGPCPATLALVTHFFVNSYSATTGVLGTGQPDYGDLTGVPSTFAPSAHNILSASHGDTTAAAAVRGDGFFAIGATPTWQRLAHPATTGGYFKWNGTDIVASTGAASGTGTPTACSNQVVTALTLNADAAPTSTCTTVTTAFLPGSGATTVNGQTCTLGSTCTIPLSAVNPETATYQVLAADFSNYKTITVASGTFTITLVASGAQPAAGQYIQIINYGSGVVTVARSGQNINGAAGNFTLGAGSATAPTSTFIESDGTNYFAAIDEGTVGTITSVATTSPITGGTVTSGAVTVACATCVTSAAALTNNQLVFGAGGQASAVGDLSGDATTSGGKTTTVVQIEGAAIPVSAAVVSTNASKQLTASTPHQVTLPLQCADTSASATTYTCTTTPTIAALTTGDTFIFTGINQNNSGSSTLNVDAIGAKTIKKYQNTANLAAGDLQLTASVLLTYDGTNFELDEIGNAPSGTGTVTSAVIAGTANQVTASGTCTITTTGTCTLSLPSAVILGTDGSVAGTVQLANGGASAHTIYSSGATTTNTIAGFTAVPTTLDLVECTSSGTTCTLTDAGILTANVVTASANGTTKQLCTVAASNKACTWIDFPDVKYIPAANCNNTTAGSGWGIGSGGTVTCRAGTNNLGGYVSITDTSTTFATFQIEIPEDWDTASNPYIRFQIASTDATNNHTIIPEINVACYKGDGSTTDDVAANGFHSLSTTTLNGSANRFWSGSTVQMNSTDVTGCVAGALMQVTVGRATDTATNAQFYGATVTFPRLLTVQSN